tara:strand:- start:1055 stop:1243 length:189 start_codon:yes stop_codon:yes gene_type:complete
MTTTVSIAALIRAQTALEMFAMDLGKIGNPRAGSFADSAKQLQQAIDNVDVEANLVELKPHS